MNNKARTPSQNQRETVAGWLDFYGPTRLVQIIRNEDQHVAYLAMSSLRQLSVGEGRSDRAVAIAHGRAVHINNHLSPDSWDYVNVVDSIR